MYYCIYFIFLCIHVVDLPVLRLYENEEIGDNLKLSVTNCTVTVGLYRNRRMTKIEKLFHEITTSSKKTK